LCTGDEGPIFRTVTGFGEDGVPEAVFNVAYGPDAVSTTDWLDGTFDTLAFRRAEVDARTVSTVTINPE